MVRRSTYLDEIEVNFQLIDSSILRILFQERADLVEVGCNDIPEASILAYPPQELSNTEPKYVHNYLSSKCLGQPINIEQKTLSTNQITYADAYVDKLSETNLNTLPSLYLQLAFSMAYLKMSSISTRLLFPAIGLLVTGELGDTPSRPVRKSKTFIGCFSDYRAV